MDSCRKALLKGHTLKLKLFNRNQHTEAVPATSSSRFPRSVKIVAMAIGLVAGGYAISQAAFTTNSSPWAGATVATVSHPTAWADVPTDLWPGYAEDTVIGITNTNPKPVEVTGISFVGWRNCSDPAASHEGNDCRLEDFLVNNYNGSDGVGTIIQPGETTYLTLTNAVGLEGIADDARQGHTVEAGYFVAFRVLPGTEV